MTNSRIFPDFSIVIPTTRLNRLTIKCVRECLKHCKGAKIIVVTDCHYPQEHNFVAEKNVEIISSKDLTIAAKRNLAAELATTTFLAFIDSDAYPENDWLHNSLEVFEADSRIAAVCGPNLSPRSEPKSELIVGLAQKSELSVIDAKKFKNKGEQCRVKFAPSVNFIIRRSVFKELGGMDEELSGGEDIEFCSRLCAQDKPIEYSPRVIVRHKNRTIKEFFLKKFSYGAMAVDLLNRKFTFNGFLCLAPFFLVLFIFLGLPFFWYLGALEVYATILLGYCLVLLIETFRCIDSIRHAPLVFGTLIISTAAPGLGSLLRLLGQSPPYKKIYRNYK